VSTNQKNKSKETNPKKEKNKDIQPVEHHSQLWNVVCLFFLSFSKSISHSHFLSEEQHLDKCPKQQSNLINKTSKSQSKQSIQSVDKQETIIFQNSMEL
jgi:hypothetical protein